MGTTKQAPEVDFDHHSSKMTWSPFDVWRRMQHDCPVARSPHHGGFYVLTNYEDVRAAVTNTEGFTTAHGSTIPDNPLPPLLPEDVDGPLHRAYRSLVNPFLSPQRVREREDWMRERANAILDQLEGRDRFDLMEDYAFPFPRWVAMDFLGLPPEDEPDLSRWTNMMLSPGDDMAEVEEAAKSFIAYLNEFVSRRRSEPPADDVASAIVHAEINGRPLTDDECLGFMLTVALGGLHTTSFAIGAGVNWLADHPEDRRRLRDDPKLMVTAVDEFIRFASPTPGVGRVTTSDTEVRGCPIPEGSRVLLVLGAANFDPERFERPDEVLLDRHPNPHVGLGMGPHRCAGSHLAKLEIRVAVEELLARYPEFRVEDHGKIAWVGGGTRGLLSVPLDVAASRSMQ